MDRNKSQQPKRQNQKSLTTGMPGFDAAMKKIVSVPKEEIEPREQAEKDAKQSSK